MSEPTNNPEPPESSPTFFSELRRRKVFRVAGVYVVVAWLMLQAGEILFPAFEIPDWGLRLVFLLALLGFPIALVLAWAFEVTPEGVKVTRSIDVVTPPEQVTPELGKKKLIAVFLLGAGVPTLGFLALLAILMLRSTPEPQPAPIDNRQSTIANSAEPADKSIAVLPLENLSEDKANEFFARGVHEDILTNLSSVPDLKVISRTSVMEYQAGGNIRDIARELQVTFVVEGSVRRSGDRVRVTAQLIRAETDEHLWAGNFDADLSDVFEVQTQIASEIAEALQLTIAPETKARLARAPTENPAAYDLFLKARDMINGITSTPNEDVYDQPENLLKTAVQMDPGFAMAWAELSSLYSLMNWFNLKDGSNLPEKSEEALDAAKKHGPGLTETLLAEGNFQYYVEENYGKALIQFEKALAQAPGNADAWFSKAMILRRFGEMEDSIAANRKAVEIDPLNSSYLSNLGGSYLTIGQWREARALFQRILEINPDNIAATNEILRIDSEVNGTFDEAMDAVLALPEDQRRSWHYFGIAFYAEVTGRCEEALAYLETAEPDFGTGNGMVFIRDFQAARVHYYNGDEERALEYTNTGYDKFRFLKENQFQAMPEEDWLRVEAYILAHLGGVEAGRAKMEKAATLNPIEKDFLKGIDAMEQLGAFYLAFGYHEEAVALFQELYEHTGSNFGGWYHFYHSPEMEEARRDPMVMAWAEDFRPDYVNNWLKTE